MHVRPEATVENLFRAHHAELSTFARGYVGCPDAAEDVVQDVFVQLCVLEGSGTTCLTPRQYLYSAVRNRALKHLAHERVVHRSQATIRSDGQVPGLSRSGALADEEMEATELAKAIDRAVDRLPARCREAYERRDVGMTHAQIAEAMGTSVRTVETQLARARRVLRRRLAPWR